MWETTRGLPIIAQLKVGIINTNEEQTPRIYHVNLQVRVPIFFRSVRGLSREKIWNLWIFRTSILLQFFFSWCYCKFRTNSSSTLPNLTPEAWQTVGFYCGYSRSSQYTLCGEPAQTMIYADSVTPMTEIVNMWHFELYLSSKGKFLSWPWKWLIVPLISDPWDYFNGISSCSSFATQQSIIDKKKTRGVFHGDVKSNQ